MVRRQHALERDEAIRGLPRRSRIPSGLGPRSRPIPDDVAGHARIVREGAIPSRPARPFTRSTSSANDRWLAASPSRASKLHQLRPAVHRCFMKVAHLASLQPALLTSHGATTSPCTCGRGCRTRPSPLGALLPLSSSFHREPLAIKDGPSRSRPISRAPHGSPSTGPPSTASARGG